MSLDIQPKTSGDRITSADYNAIVSAVNANETDIKKKLDGVKVDGTAQTKTNGYIDLKTKNGNYNASTNKLTTEYDLQTDEIERLKRISYYGLDVEPSNGLTFSFTSGFIDGYTVTGYNTEILDYPDGIVVPYEYDDGIHGILPVIAIGRECFKYNTDVLKVRLPSSINTIEDEAFYGCSELRFFYVSYEFGVNFIGNDVFVGTHSNFKMFFGKDYRLLAYCREYNIPYVTVVDSDDLATKQDILVFNTAYDASTNKAATMADVASAVGDIESLLDSANDDLEALL